MKVDMFHIGRLSSPRRGSVGLLFCVWGLLLLSLAQIRAQTPSIVVRTVGGGPLHLGGPPFGFADGDGIQNSQFNGPLGIASDRAGGVFVADVTNGVIRRLVVPSTATSTVISDLPFPVDVATDQSTNLYVLTQKDGRITKYDSSFELVRVVASNLTGPTAMAVDVKGNLYVTEIGGVLKRIGTDGAISILAQGLHGPRGVDVLDSGAVVVSDTEDHSIKIFEPRSGLLTTLAGGGGAGFTDGNGSKARFNRPHQLAKAPNGMIIVADRMNHRVRMVDTNGLTSTLYGVNPAKWSDCASCFPGWFDGTNNIAEAREPVGVAVDSGGVVFTTESFYHLIRTTSVASLQATNSVNLESPVIAPSSGYFPMGQLISVSSAVRSVFYTTDGSEPTTNSTPVLLDGNNRGLIKWSDGLRDLTSLRLKAFDSTNSSLTVSGEPALVTEIGLASDVSGGVGATVVVPVVVNLRSNDSLKSLQFRVEITPNNPKSGIISSRFRALSVGSNDFVRVATADSSSGGRSSFGTVSGLVGDTRIIAVSFIGTNSNFSIRNFAVVAMLAIPVPETAKPGDLYSLRITEPSATSDGQQTPVPIVPMPSRTLIVGSTPYIVGDTAKAAWYNSGTFGDGDLKNDDVNNVFNASLGVRVPYDFSDLFNAMDVFPEDSPGIVGGDGQIRFLDWQTLLLRSLRLRAENWQRDWSLAGVRQTESASLIKASPLSSSQLQKRLPGAIWVRQARLYARDVDSVTPGNVIDIPVYLKTAAGSAVSGLQFRVVVTPSLDAPPLDRQVEFFSLGGYPQPVRLEGVPLNQVACGWSLGSFEPILSGEVLLGHVRMKVPISATKGVSYSIAFLNADGAPDVSTQYDFETLSGSVWVLAKPATVSDSIPDEWKIRFFGSAFSPSALAGNDTDSDGLSNLQEFQAGTDPTSADSKPQISVRSISGNGGIRLSWVSAPGKRYRLERSDTINSVLWDVLGSTVSGDGDIVYVDDPQPGSTPVRFYRLRLVP